MRLSIIMGIIVLVGIAFFTIGSLSANLDFFDMEQNFSNSNLQINDNSISKDYQLKLSEDMRINSP